jgi:hypothetical protein
MTRIFVSYRRVDTADYAKRLYDRLSVDFGSDAVFMDVATISPGAKYDIVIQEAVSKCDVLLAVIGPKWLIVADASGRRLDNAEDLVRIEIASALKRDVLVIPILVHGAGMPKRQELPEVLAGLAQRNALEMSDADWECDIARLERAVQSVVRLRSLGMKITFAQQYCPVCGEALPRLRMPQTWRDTLWGGGTCPNCGTKLDRHGRVLA